MTANSSVNVPESHLAVLRRLMRACSRKPGVELRRLRGTIQSYLIDGCPDDGLATLVGTVREREWADAAKEIDLAEQSGVRVLSIFDPDFPDSLKLIADPPLMFFARGKIPASPKIAIVGSRRATPYGNNFARSLARELSSRGVSIVSGLARGVDTNAHEGSLPFSNEPGTPGIAVLGSGVNRIYPPENRELANAILEAGGAVISEYGVDSAPRDFHFPERNRLISALSSAVIVIEAEEKSGALITARIAAEQGRDVFAVPGSVASPLSGGTNKLIKDGASVLTSIDDLSTLLVKLNISAAPAANKKPDRSARLTAEQKQILAQLDPQIEKSIDSLTEQAGLTPQKLHQLLSELELGGFVTSLPGGLYVRN